jgi:succinate dehydrogenase / fumarate reductase membrane anchor subunit
MNLRSDLGRARGLGAAKEGVAHWWAQRVTAVALVPLSLWLAASLAMLAGADHKAAVAWIGAPVNSVLLAVTLGVTFHHTQLGLQVVIEDYVHCKAMKVASIVLVKFASVLLAAASVFAVLKIAFAG